MGDLKIKGLSDNSNTINPGDLFIAVKGSNSDGHDFAKAALEKGAIAVVIEKDMKDIDSSKKIIVEDTKTALSLIADNFYNHPLKKLKIIGITGTNGKTTVSYILEKALNKNKINCGLIGTINYKLKERVIKASNTTPGNLELFKLFSDMAKEGLGYVSMEVSSHALSQDRVRGIDFNKAVFANISGDHLDYHRTFKNYLEAKLTLFRKLNKDAAAIINSDDRHSKYFKDATKGRIISYGIKNKSEIMGRDIKVTPDYSQFLLVTPKGSIRIKTPLIGIHNVYNALAASCVLFDEGFGLKEIKEGIEALELVEGRLEKIDIGQDFKVYVDFAHTEDALFNVLSSLRPLTKKRLIVIFGCGGDRDRTKRPKMGKVVSELSDYFIITSDNPRSEDPKGISDEILDGIKQGPRLFDVILDRRLAIEKAINMAEAGDVVIIAGKGHEDYQIFKDKTVIFSDRKVAEDFLNKKMHMECRAN